MTWYTFLRVVYCSAYLSLLIAKVSYAQPVPPPVFPAVDERGVDVATGAFVHAQTDVVIGQLGAGGLAFSRYYQTVPGTFWTHNHNGFLHGSGTTCSVVVGTSTETFSSTSNDCLGTFTSLQQMGSTLVYSSSTAIYTYTTRDGMVITFARFGPDHWVLNQNAPSTWAYLRSITNPAGEVITYDYEGESICFPDPYNCWVVYNIGRILTVSNNTGYRLWFTYPASPASGAQADQVTGINNAVEYCVPTACSQTWPSATYTYSSFGQVTSATNALNHATTYSYTAPANLLTEVQFPDHADHDVNIGYDSNARVTSIDLGFGSWSYAYSDAGGFRTTTVTNPGPSTRTYESTLSNGRINSVTNELSETISYLYDPAARQTKVTLPEGNYAQYTYDSRGNITQIERAPKSGSGLSSLYTSASYPTSCTNPRTCNQPDSTTDAAGFQTDYTYDAAHGGVLTITAPAPSGSAPVGSGDRPQARVTYEQFQARYLIGTSTWTNGPAVWRPTVESSCASGTAPSCLGTDNETRVTKAYENSNDPNNVLPVSITTAAGDGSPSSTSAMTYTNWSDIKTVNGPLTGSADETRMYYDNLRRVTGVVGPDPDADGTLKRRAVRTTYNSVGQPTVVERGTVTNQTDSAFSTFALLEKQDTVYDSFGRPVQSRVFNGSVVAALSQFSYDNRGRLECTAVRMNSATFNSLPSSACTVGTAGSYGPDRISRTEYDAASRVEEQQSGYGTALAQTTAAFSYTSNGQVLTLTDARSYRTTYEYDGHDRLTKLFYPDPSTPNQSSTLDFDGVTFDPYSGRLSQQRRRSGDSFTFTFDNLGRITLRDAPGTQPDVSFAYDLLNRETLRSQSGYTLGTAYDALSRVTSITGVLGAVEYEYDNVGRRTRIEYPDGFYVTYGYNTASDLTGIFENGAASLATYVYDDLGRRTSLTRGNGVVTRYTFDALSRLSTLEQDASNSSHDTKFTFGYNPSSQITSRTRTNGVFDWVPPLSFSDSYTANGLNQYSNADGVTPAYDSRGNLTNDGVKTYGYDFDNRMISASGGVTLQYDPASRLHEVAGAATTRFLYDGSDLIAEYNTSGTVLRRYVHGPGADEPLLWYEGSGTSDKRYLIADERGSVIGVTNGSGSVTSVNTYDAYGVRGSGNSGLFQYTGQIWLSDVGLYHYKARAYHPKLGRFLQTDPIGVSGRINLYAYVGNDPTNRVDPSGLCWHLLATGYMVVEADNGGKTRTPYKYQGDEYLECLFALLGSQAAESDGSGTGDGNGNVDASSGGAGAQSNNEPALSCPRSYETEFRSGAFLAVSGNLYKKLAGLEIDLDGGSLRIDLMTGEKRMTSGITFGITFLGINPEYELWQRDVPWGVRGRSWHEQSVSPGGSVTWPQEADSDRSIPGTGIRLGLGVGIGLGADVIAPNCAQ